MDDFRRYRNQSSQAQPTGSNPWAPRPGAPSPNQYGGNHSQNAAVPYNSISSSGPASSYDSPHSESSSMYGGSTLNDDEREYNYARSQVRDLRQDTLASSQNALKTLRQTEEVGAAALNTIGNQTMQLSATDRQLNIAGLQTDVSLDKTAKLKQLNRPFWAPAFSNPFGRTKKREAELERAKAKHQDIVDGNAELARRDVHDRQRLLNIGWTAEPEVDDKKNKKGKDKNGGPSPHPSATSASGSAWESPNPNSRFNRPPPGMSAAERQRYMLKGDNGEYDEEESRMEDEIHNNTNEMLSAVSNLKNMGLNMRSELTLQNQRLGSMAEQSDKVSGKIFTSQYRVDKM
ncbi:Protein transport protein S9 plasma membrane t-SNARE [Dimargaris cristalligena]|nr:Protein transport protein S9 plasma membrane t-SNARE [Dimargaris cristalligena]